jgi:hypothetical protein
MFDDPSLVGCWERLAGHLDDDGVLQLWAASEPELSDLTDLERLLAAWDDPARMHGVGSALVRLAAADGGRDDDALVLLLHLLSGVVWRLVAQLGDLSRDITAIVIGELTCQIRSYRWRRRGGRLIPNLECETRRAVLADLRPSSRYHPERVERLSWDGELVDGAASPMADLDELRLVDVLQFAIAHGADRSDLQLLVDSECARGRRGAAADATVAASRGISRRTLLRRRERALAALRRVAPAYLAAAA